jgi:hypothetical protein
MDRIEYADHLACGVTDLVDSERLAGSGFGKA